MPAYFEKEEIPADVGGDGMGLFIFIVASAVGDVEPTMLHMIDEAVFFVDAAAVFAQQIAGEGFRFPDSLHTAVPFNILDELVDPL